MKIVLALVLGLIGVGLAGCENPEDIQNSQLRLEGKLPSGCHVTYGGVFNTGSRQIPTFIVDCRGVRATTTNGAYSSGKSMAYATTIMLTEQ